jgi:hypothetical protein
MAENGSCDPDWVLNSRTLLWGATVAQQTSVFFKKYEKTEKDPQF